MVTFHWTARVNPKIRLADEPVNHRKGADMETGIFEAQLHPSCLKTSVWLIPERRACPNKSETWRNSENNKRDRDFSIFVCVCESDAAHDFIAQ